MKPNKEARCLFHQIYEHNTKKGYSLIRQIKKHICECCLAMYKKIMDSPTPKYQKDNTPPKCREDDECERPILWDFNTIVG